ncbi:MAG: hypothetical protein ACRD4W_08240 [Nitrososphaeraceae archaeon]
MSFNESATVDFPAPGIPVRQITISFFVVESPVVFSTKYPFPSIELAYKSLGDNKVLLGVIGTIYFRLKKKYFPAANIKTNKISQDMIPN